MKILDHEAVSRSPLWSTIENAANFDEISHTLNTIITDNSSSIIKRSRGSYTNPWISREIIDAIHFRDLLSRYSKRFPQNLLISSWHSQAKKDIIRKIRRAKKDFCDKKIADSLHDSKKLWKNLKEIIHNKPHSISSVTPLTTVEDARAECDRFNEFFVNVGTSLSAGYPLPSEEYYSSFSYSTANYLSLSLVPTTSLS